MQIPPIALSPDRAAMLMDKAKELEATFLAEMLSYAGAGEAGHIGGDSFSGGAGEQQFASFLRAEHARAIVDKGGIGLAEMLFHSLSRAEEVKRGE